jgi:anhydro-N-acetylmuramic acid kinase
LPASNDLYVGIMSGTSLDGIDVALCRFAGPGKVDLLIHRTYDWPRELRERLAVLVGAGMFSVDELTTLNFDLARAYGAATEQLLEESKIARSNVRAIGLHGQTIRHLPASLATWQLGSGSALAALTQIDVVHDFRSADVALGGQGAPLVPMFDLLFLHSPVQDRLVTNIGGITNVTYIPRSGKPDEVIAYDTGPGNMIIDALAQQLFGRPYDNDGELAKSGTIDEVLLSELLAHPYFLQAPPKSTGRELMQADFISRFVMKSELSPKDAIATGTELTARTLADAANKLPSTVELVLSGGGAKNGFLVERIQNQLREGSSVVLSHKLGIDEQAKESIAFAFFAKARIDKQLIHLPKTTGASRAILLGSVARGR